MDRASAGAVEFEANIAIIQSLEMTRFDIICMYVYDYYCHYIVILHRYRDSPNSSA